MSGLTEHLRDIDCIPDQWTYFEVVFNSLLNNLSVSATCEGVKVESKDFKMEYLSDYLEEDEKLLSVSAENTM